MDENDNKETGFDVTISHSDYDFENTEALSYLPKYVNILSLDFDLIGFPDFVSKKYNSASDKKDFLVNQFTILAEKKKVISFPFYKMDHSYVTYSIHEFGGLYGYWDSGQIGFVYITEANAKKLLSVKTFGAVEKQEIEKLIDKQLNFINELNNNGFTDIAISYKGKEFFTWTGLILEISYNKEAFIKNVYDSFIETFNNKTVTIKEIENLVNEEIL
jgi:hypothetical protein